MKVFRTIILMLLVLLGLAAGGAKVMLMPEEAAFMGSMGFSELMIILFGAAQIAGSVLLVPKQTRLAGAMLTALMLTASMVVIFMSGKMIFAAVSLLPVIMAGMLIVDAIKSSPASAVTGET